MEIANELDSTNGIPDEELTNRFREAVRIDNEIKKKSKDSPFNVGTLKKRNPIFNMPTVAANTPKIMSEKIKLPEIMVFAGPNGSGKSTITKLANVIEPYINADEIKQRARCSNRKNS